MLRLEPCDELLRLDAQDLPEPNERFHLVNVAANGFRHLDSAAHIRINADLEQRALAMLEPPQKPVKQTHSFARPVADRVARQIDEPRRHADGRQVLAAQYPADLQVRRATGVTPGHPLGRELGPKRRPSEAPPALKIRRGVDTGIKRRARLVAVPP
jgi:hypothetical protein